MCVYIYIGLLLIQRVEIGSECPLLTDVGIEFVVWCARTGQSVKQYKSARHGHKKVF